MAFCGNCGTKMEDGVKFCPGCGAAVAAPAPPPVQNNAGAAPTQPIQNNVGTAPVYTAPVVPGALGQADIKDAQDNKVMAILAYFGPLVLIPMFAAKNSKFARYHSNQGLVLFIACIIYSIAYSIVSAIVLAISWRLYFITSILGFVSIAFTVWAVLGIINACKGEMKPLPFIGHITILK